MSLAESKDTKDTTAIINKAVPSILEEDDEFEEFPIEDWEGGMDEYLKIEQWEADWDDDVLDDDFAVQLRAELQSQGAM